jgi:hypothetical protein
MPMSEIACNDFVIIERLFNPDASQSKSFESERDYASCFYYRFRFVVNEAPCERNKSVLNERK